MNPDFEQQVDQQRRPDRAQVGRPAEHVVRNRAETEREIERGTERLPRGSLGDRRHGVRGKGGARERSLVQISPG